MSDPIANHILRGVMHELVGTYAAGWNRSTHSIAWSVNGLFIRTIDGHLIQVQARELPADHPAAKLFAVVDDPAAEG